MHSHRVFAAAIALLLAGCACFENQTTVLIARHAEKAAGTDPSLTSKGRAQAVALAKRLADVKIDAIYATELRRTQQTAKPLADATGVGITTILRSQWLTLVDKIRKEHQGKTVVIIGHSTNIPGLVSALGSDQPLSIEPHDYERLYVLRVGPHKTSWAIEHF